MSADHTIAHAAVRLITEAIQPADEHPGVHCIEGQLYYAQANVVDDVIEVTVWPAAFDAEGEAARVVLTRPTATNEAQVQTNGQPDPVMNVPDPGSAA